MATRLQQLQQIWHQFDKDHGHLPTGTREASEWAVSAGLLDLPHLDPLDALAAEMAKALREEYATDARGRRYRVNHAIRVTQLGVQYTFWAMMGYAQRPHMERAFAQRREQIVGDCLQLKIDVDAYNGMHKDAEPIQLILDFTDDVAERQYWEDDEAA